MKIFGIISEYNPLHNGHIYQIKRIKKEYPEAYIIALTSGSFVQRGEPSFISKHFKARQAVENGVDLFIEMPTIISLQSANYFSFYSLKLLNKLNILTNLSFGVENIDKEDLNNLVTFEIENQGIIDLEIKNLMNEGYSYKKAYEQTYAKLGLSNDSLYSLPNNTLAIQYVKAIKLLESNIDIFPVKRNDKGYHSCYVPGDTFQSATAIRQAYSAGKSIDRYVPFYSLNHLHEINQVTLDDYSDLFFYQAIVKGASPNEIAGYENGMLNLLTKNYNNSLSEMIETSHNKRYSRSRLRRFVLNYIMGIKNSDIKSLEEINYIRPLRFNSRGALLLKLIKDNSDVKIINKLTDLSELDDINKRIVSFDVKAFKLYNINNQEKSVLDFTDNPFME